MILASTFLLDGCSQPRWRPTWMRTSQQRVNDTCLYSSLSPPLSSSQNYTSSLSRLLGISPLPQTYDFQLPFSISHRPPSSSATTSAMTTSFFLCDDLLRNRPPSVKDEVVSEMYGGEETIMAERKFDSNEMKDNTDHTDQHPSPSIVEKVKLLEIGMIFSSKEEVHTFYNSYATNVGFGISKLGDGMKMLDIIGFVFHFHAIGQRLQGVAGYDPNDLSEVVASEVAGLEEHGILLSCWF
ncbi:hypothetical protein ZIOFF_051261 [Zingiber officinale]|uniref:Uncharacterized protein n=1 Tax=Zingiber officinale TaxID=94328 RepID=A0A8J5KQX0_ZINOF|nr:hypothetical protein ZIOFF_051261 [Zingiber officinale]